ncbi:MULTISPECIES: YhfC family glutamic-type intramembrane protease [Eubacteriales]|uniref:YhfC family glutamic-type intramembrane protease n=1 Tax=Eubacteriales TaxID=186802 RepID=UPI00336AAED1
MAALPVHLAATRLVFAGVRRCRALPLLAAFALHTLVDLLAALGPLAELPLWGIEGGLLAVAALLAAWMIGDRRREGKEKRGCR